MISKGCCIVVSFIVVKGQVSVAGSLRKGYRRASARNVLLLTMLAPAAHVSVTTTRSLVTTTTGRAISSADTSARRTSSADTPSGEYDTRIRRRFGELRRRLRIHRRPRATWFPIGGRCCRRRRCKQCVDPPSDNDFQPNLATLYPSTRTVTPATRNMCSPAASLLPSSPPGTAIGLRVRRPRGSTADGLRGFAFRLTQRRGVPPSQARLIELRPRARVASFDGRAAANSAFS